MIMSDLNPHYLILYSLQYLISCFWSVCDASHAAPPPPLLQHTDPTFSCDVISGVIVYLSFQHSHACNT